MSHGPYKDMGKGLKSEGNCSKQLITSVLDFHPSQYFLVVTFVLSPPEMTWSPTIRSCFVACFSSAVTVVALLLLIRPGHDNMVNTFIDGVRSGSSVYAVSNPRPKSEECPVVKQTQELSPTKFVRDPWKYPVCGRSKGAKKTDWWDSLLTSNGGFPIVEEQNN
ncbi:hypothetical protein M434DRAFT_30068 [Hypoxylon sp. CO27-5]|nr:hypothetical protein M434DRAFT_30068 [Hypoxylon sp. CO27-5]